MSATRTQAAQQALLCNRKSRPTVELDLIGGKDPVNDDFPKPKLFRVLSLDGGGAKGFYTLGALMEVEALVGRRLCEKFDLIYGTSTGAIIAALLGLGKSANEIEGCTESTSSKSWARFLPEPRKRPRWRSSPRKYSGN